jgi:hypothetical protein
LLQAVPFDLHVLSTPPAFVLSQNQTLRKVISENEILTFMNRFVIPRDHV